MMTYPEFMEILVDSKRSAGSAIEHAVGAIRTVRAGDQFEDDVSIVEVSF